MAKYINMAERLKMFVQTTDHYEEKLVGEFVYIKQWNGNSQKWQVSEFTQASYTRYKAYTRKPSILEPPKKKRPSKPVKPKRVSKKQHQENVRKAREILDSILDK